MYEIAYYYRIGLDVRFVKYFVDVTFYYIIPYGVLTYLGYNYFNLTNRYKLITILVAFGTFVCLAIYYWGETGTFQIVQIAKYPPRLYYMSYGIGCSFALLLICEKKNLKVFGNKLIVFISTHSMWIYLWHIFVLKIYRKLKFPDVWFIKLIIVYLLSMLIVIIVNKILDSAERGHHFPIIKFLRG